MTQASARSAPLSTSVTTQKIKLVDAVVQGLLAWGVRHVFGVSGANIEHLHDAIHRLGVGNIASVMAKSESGAAFMADGYARVHRRLGVCCSTSGGGMMNLAVGIAESHAESVPVLALVGQPPATGEGRGAFQDSSGIGRTVDAVTFFQGIAKFVSKIDTAEAFWPSFEQALVEALAGRPGPAVLLFPRSIWTTEVAPLPMDFAARIRAAIRPVPVDQLGVAPRGEETPEMPVVGSSRRWKWWRRGRLREETPRSPAGAITPEPESIRLSAGVSANPQAVRGGLLALLEELRRSRHPVLLVGQGIRRCSNPAVVIEFARALQLPVMTDLSARGEVPNDDPLYLGMLGVAGHPSAHHYLRDRADLLFLAGTGFNAMTRAQFIGDPTNILAKRLLAVNIDMGELSRIVQPARQVAIRSWWPDTANNLRVAIEADVGVVFEELLRLWHKDPFKVRPPGSYRFEKFRSTLAAEMPPPKTPLRGTLLQSEALDILQKALPRGGNIVYDAGNCAAAALHQLYVPPGTSATIALGMGGMGYAIAAATGIALGSTREQRTLVLAGDGALLMAGLEIHTAVDLGLPILFVIFNNAMHGMCVTRQQKFFEGRLECVRYAPIDVAALARGLGKPASLWVGQARTREELQTALRDQAVQSDKPGVLELILAREEIPPFTPLLPRGTEHVESPPPDWEWD